MSNILIDFYQTEDTQTGFEHFFAKHADWIFEDIQRYHERTGQNWWESKDAADFWVNHAIVKAIIDNFFDKQILLRTHLQWLRKLSKAVIPDLTVGDGNDADIDLSKNHLLFTYYDALYGLALQPIYKLFYDELIKMLREEKTGIKRCPSCRKLFEPTPRGHAQIFCGATCKMRYYRKYKENY
jgi:hypothetical protein